MVLDNTRAPRRGTDSTEWARIIFTRAPKSITTCRVARIMLAGAKLLIFQPFPPARILSMAAATTSISAMPSTLLSAPLAR